MEEPEDLGAALKRGLDSQTTAVVEVVTALDYSQPPGDLVPYDLADAR